MTIELTTCNPSEAGIEVLVLEATNGCDSVVTIITELIPTPNAGTDGIANICSGTPLSPGVLFAALGNNPDPFGSLNTTNNTIFYYVVTNGICSDTSVITINYIEPTKDTISLTSCNPLEVGVITDSLTSSNGCDSIVTTITTLTEPYETVIIQESSNPADTGMSIEIFTALNGCDSMVTKVTILILDNQEYATLNYLTLFADGIDEYWTLHTDGSARIETRRDPIFSLTGKKKIIIDAPSLTQSVAYADLHINLNPSGSGDINLFFWWKKYDNGNQDTIGVYYVNEMDNSISFITKFKGGKDLIGRPELINLTRWANKKGITLSEKSTIRFLYQTNKKVPTNIFASGGGFALDLVSVFQNASPIALKQEAITIAETEEQEQAIARKMDDLYEELGLLEEEEIEINIYPNPVVKGQDIYIDLSLNIGEDIILELYNVEGKLIDRVLYNINDLYSQSLILSTQKVGHSGTYFVHVISDKGRAIQKIQIVSAF
jgi:hypothetical protein